VQPDVPKKCDACCDALERRAPAYSLGSVSKHAKACRRKRVATYATPHATALCCQKTVTVEALGRRAAWSLRVRANRATIRSADSARDTSLTSDFTSTARHRGWQACSAFVQLFHEGARASHCSQPSTYSPAPARPKTTTTAPFRVAAAQAPAAVPRVAPAPAATARARATRATAPRPARAPHRAMARPLAAFRFRVPPVASSTTEARDRSARKKQTSCTGTPARVGPAKEKPSPLFSSWS